MYPTTNILLFASLDLLYFATVLNYFCSLTNYIFRNIKLKSLNNISIVKNKLKL